MRTSMKRFSNALMPMALLLSVAACNDNDDLPRPGFSKVELHAAASSNSGGGTVTIGDFAVSDFIVGTQEVNMMYLPAAAVEAGVTIENGTLKPNNDAPLAKSASEARELIVVAEGDHQTAKIGEGETHNGIYSEITFKLHKITGPSVNDVVSGKSFFLSGDWNGTAVVIFLENEESILAPSRSAEGYEVSGKSSFIINFNLDRILANVNFGAAEDFNQNGIIEIGPNNVDANGSIYTVIRNNINASVNFEVE